jgi:tryptophan synthase alpha chain
MSAIDDLFQDLRRRGQKAFMPFVTAGDPDLQFTAEILRELTRRGCNLCEVGVPYSDPIADGPVIQASYTRALRRGVRVSQILEMISSVSRDTPTPLVSMVSYAIVYRYGPERFIADAKASGFSGAIVPDLLVEEAEPLRKICEREDYSLIQLVTPTTPKPRALRIAETSSGFLYYVSVTGITGERTQLPPELQDNVAWLREQTELPVCIGFGISQPEHVKLLAPAADGLIVGSALVRRIAQADERSREEVIADVGQFAELLQQALA